MIENEDWRPVSAFVPGLEYRETSDSGAQELVLPLEIVAVWDDERVPVFCGNAQHFFYKLHERETQGHDDWPSVMVRTRRGEADATGLTEVWLYGTTVREVDTGRGYVHLSTYQYRTLAEMRLPAGRQVAA